MKKLITILSILIAAIAAKTEACDFCILSQGISPLETIKGAGIRVNERYTLLNNVYSGTNKVANRGAKEEYWTTEITGFYGITEDAMLLAVIPYKKTKLDGHLHVHADGEVEVHSDMKGEETGIGDIAALGRYTFFKTHTIDTTTSFAGIAGVKFPTGKTDGKTDDGMKYLDSHLQLGTGSTDFIMGLSMSHAVQRLSLSANLLGVIPTEGKAGNTKHQFGNTLNYDITAKYRVHPAVFAPLSTQLFFSLGLNGELREREKENGVEIVNSGGHTIYLTPGIQVVTAPHWAVELSYQHPVYHNLYGTQIGEEYKVNSGVTYLF
jgi:hypothetical protein